jgi:hypothetical protein
MAERLSPEREQEIGADLVRAIEDGESRRWTDALRDLLFEIDRLRAELVLARSWAGRWQDTGRKWRERAERAEAELARRDRGA